MWNAWNTDEVSERFPAIPGTGNANNTITIITGNTLGGTSAINGMQWVVPLEGTVEKWRVRGLTTESSRKYYERAFRQVGYKAQVGSLRHIHAKAYIRAAGLAGFPRNDDPFDNRVQRDIFENRLAVDRKGRRIDSCQAYLTPVIKGKCKKNLRLVQGITVTKVLLQGKRASSVQYVSSRDTKLRHPRTLHARKEVIISAGPFGSPKLLQLSGIGPEKVLSKAGVPVKVELPVGVKTQSRNFISIASEYRVRLEPSNNSTLLNSADARRQWETGKGGVLGISSFLSNGRDKRNAYTTGTGSFFPAFIDKKFIASNCNGNVNSFGYLRIKDSNPFTPPEVDLAILKEREDVERLKRCLKPLTEIHRQFPKRYKMKFIDPVDGRYNESWIRKNAGWAGHFVGGCPVGSVLRSDLSVRKLKGLRVVDSSALSIIPLSSGPMASTYMLAEYAAELISQQYR